MDKSAFDSHPLWASLDQLDDLLKQAEAKEVAGTESALGELRYLVSSACSHSDPSDAAPYSAAALSAVNGNLPNVINEVANFVSSENVAHLTNAQNYADQVLNLLGNWPVASLKGGAAAQANKLFTEFREAADEALSTLRASNIDLRAQLDSQQTAHDAAVTALTAEITALSTKITADEARLDTALTTTNEAFTTKQTEREDRFTVWLEEQSKALKGLAKEDLAAIQDNKEQADTALAQVNALRDDTQAVAGLAAGDQVARGYKAYSLRQWIAGLAAYVVGFAFLAIGVVLVIRTIKGIEPGDDISWQFTVLKLGLTASAVFAAVIAFRLGSHLLAEASTAKQFELELKALGPLFPHDEEQGTLQTVKKDLIERSFGRGWNTGERSKDVMDEKFLERIVEAVARGFVRPPPGT